MSYDPEGRLDRPPLDASRAVLAPDFGRRFLVFVDTEEEFDWSAPFRRDAATTTLAALPDAQRRLRGAGIAPTYLVTWPIADDPRAGDMLRPWLAAGECDVGAQLHPWVTPPFAEAVTQANSFAGNLPFDIEHAKLISLTDRIETAVGRRPTSYRAGRYGVGANSAALLDRTGYRLDVSTRPLHDYGAEGGPDFAGHPIWPWWAGPKRHLLELPLGAAFVGALRRHAGLYRHAPPLLRGLLGRSRLLSRIALTPEGMPVADTLAAVRALLDDGTQVLSLSFHSPSLVPGHTPYVRDRADLSRFWRWWDAVLDLLAREDVAPASPAELLDAAWRAR